MICPHCKKSFKTKEDIKFGERLFNLWINGKKEDIERIKFDRSGINLYDLWNEKAFFNKAFKKDDERLFFSEIFKNLS